MLTLFKKGCKYIFSHIYKKSTYVVYEKQLNPERKKISVQQIHVEFSKISNFNNNIYLLLKSVNPSLSKKNYKKDVRKGNECFVGKKNNQLLFFVWTRKYQSKYPDRHKFKGYPVESKKEIHFFTAVTKEAYRGKNIYPAGIQFLENYYEKLEYEKISCIILKEKNKKNASQKSLIKINFKKTKKQITMTKILFYKRFKRNYSVKFNNI